MPDLLTYFYLFPVGIAISILAISAGISGSDFWIPVYFIWLGIDPKISFWLALFTMLFGTGSGIVRNLKNRTINWSVVKQYLIMVVPFAIMGALIFPFAPIKLLLVLFGSFVITYAVYLIYRFEPFFKRKVPPIQETGEKIYRIYAALAGFSQGLICTGSGKILLPFILKHSKIRSAAEAVGSTVVIIFTANLFASLFRLTPGFVSILAQQKDMIFYIMIWVAPGVTIGGQIAPYVTQHLSKRGVEFYVGILLVFAGILICVRSFSGF